MSKLFERHIKLFNQKLFFIYKKIIYIFLTQAATLNTADTKAQLEKLKAFKSNKGSLDCFSIQKRDFLIFRNYNIYYTIIIYLFSIIISMNGLYPLIPVENCIKRYLELHIIFLAFGFSRFQDLLVWVLSFY